MRVLLLDDDDELRRAIADTLRSRGMSVDEARLAAEADEKLQVNRYDVAILDRAVPDGDAATMLSRVRRRGVTTPVLFLTALDAVSDRIAGLDAGGDDYLVKPFALEELLARVRALGRRSGAVDAPVLVLADLRIDPARVSATRGGSPITLTPKEFALLTHLVRNAGRVVSRSELLEHCWDEFADPSSNVIEVRMRLLRGKLGEPALIHTVRGAGYLADEVPAPS